MSEQTQTERVRAAFKANPGATADKIAKAVGCKIGLVYTVKSVMRKAKEEAREKSKATRRANDKTLREHILLALARSPATTPAIAVAVRDAGYVCSTDLKEQVYKKMGDLVRNKEIVKDQDGVYRITNVGLRAVGIEPPVAVATPVAQQRVDRAVAALTNGTPIQGQPLTDMEVLFQLDNLSRRSSYGKVKEVLAALGSLKGID
jgi:hypothetical protein